MRSLLAAVLASLTLWGAPALAQGTSGGGSEPPTVDVVPPPPPDAPPAGVHAEVVITVVPSPTPAPMVPATSAAWSPAGAPPPAMAYVGDPPRPRARKHWELIGPGIGLFVGGWLLTWLATSVWYGETTSCSSTGWFGYSCTHYGPQDLALGMSFVPLVGPWLMLGDDGLRGADYLVPVLFGLIQTTGLVMLIVGLSLPGEVEELPLSLRFGGGPVEGGGVATVSGRF